MQKKKILIAIGIFLLLGLGIYKGFFEEKKPTFELVEVVRGNIVEEISETGRVSRGEEISLSFENSGKIETIYVKVGDLIRTGGILAKLDTSQLKIQLQEAQANFEIAEAELDKLLAGATTEEIKIAETEVKNSEISLEIAKENLSQAYEDALNTLDDSYLKLYNAFNEVDSIQRSYFNSNDQESIKVRENKEKIEKTLSQAQSHLDAAKDDPKNANIEVALSEMKDSLETTSESLEEIREICETPYYRSVVSSTDKDSLDDHRSYINTALSNVLGAQQTISSMKLSVDSAEGDFQKAKDKLSQIKAEPRQEDISLYKAQVKQAQAQINLLEIKIQESILTAPTAGEIIKVNKKAGEIVQSASGECVISLLPSNPFQIKVDIYEEDVVKINIGDSVDIDLVSFPNKTFNGKIISIEPAEKLIEGVVYYETTIDFTDTSKGIKPGMTADVLIQKIIKENVLLIPEGAIEKEAGKTVVQVLKNGQLQEREIEIGLEGSDDMVEVISGLEEGERVCLFK